MKISVIIPAYNEEKNIDKVIKSVKSCGIINEIIVVDNNSNDKTSEIAKNNNVKTIFCKKQGKGYAMKAGIKQATGEIIVFVDGDICNFKESFIYDLIKPIINNKADFVKASFKRDGGRVTELVAKPLLELKFPKLKKFKQPLSGIIAGKKEIIKNLKLNNDYGVDIGILIDAYKMKARIKEVDIGYIKNDSQEWKSLIKMAKEVANAILSRTE